MLVKGIALGSSKTPGNQQPTKEGAKEYKYPILKN